MRVLLRLLITDAGSPQIAHHENFWAGLVAAYILKTLYFGRHSSIREISLMILIAYLSYMLAELLQLSGILTVFFCGILMSHYAWYDVTDSSRITTRHVFATMSFIVETFIFLYVGMDALDIEKWKITKLSILTINATLSISSCDQTSEIGERLKDVPSVQQSQTLQKSSAASYQPSNL